MPFAIPQVHHNGFPDLDLEQAFLSSQFLIRLASTRMTQILPGVSEMPSNLTATRVLRKAVRQKAVLTSTSVSIIDTEVLKLSQSSSLTID